jgi:hypothetical protein
MMNASKTKMAAAAPGREAPAKINTAASIAASATTFRPRLTDRQLVALSAAAKRDDGTIAPPKGLVGKALASFAASLVRLGLAVEWPAKRGQPAWRRDDRAGADLTLAITDAGLIALGVEPVGDAVAAKAASTARLVAIDAGVPRPASKQARLIAMLSSANGCSIDEAATAFGWLPHTTRAALTGLRRKGHRIERVKGEAGARSRHRIIDGAAV